jgi:hypothetical protein
VHHPPSMVELLDILWVIGLRPVDGTGSLP